MRGQAIKTEIINNVIVAMSRYITDSNILGILEKVIREQLVRVEVQEIPTLPTQWQDEASKRNQYLIQLFILRKKNLGRKTMEGYLNTVKRLIVELNNKPLDQVDAMDIEWYLSQYEQRKGETIQMEAKSIEEVAKMAAKEAVSEMKKQEKKERKATIFQNTKVLMENYNRMVKSVQEGISDLSDLTDEPIEGLEEGENLFVESILRSKIRSLVMLAHIDKCLTMLENEEYDVGTPEKYLAFRYHYLDGMTYESISEVYNYSERTARRWVSELTNKMSIYLFGVDALLF